MAIPRELVVMLWLYAVVVGRRHFSRSNVCKGGQLIAGNRREPDVTAAGVAFHHNSMPPPGQVRHFLESIQDGSSGGNGRRRWGCP
jgi:hypothetical protein